MASGVRGVREGDKEREEEEQVGSGGMSEEKMGAMRRVRFSNTVPGGGGCRHQKWGEEGRGG